MRTFDWVSLGLPAAMVFASGMAFFLYVPVLVIGAAWMFLAAVLLSLGLGMKLGWTLRERQAATAQSGKNYLGESESGVSERAGTRAEKVNGHAAITRVSPNHVPVG